LVAALGQPCHACLIRPGASIDHDHFTGLVRGLLCLYCNTHIDGCLHVSGLGGPSTSTSRRPHTYG
jgi:hypothetical protein